MEAKDFPKDNYFKIDVEAHLVGDLRHIEYFPGVQAWWRGIAGVTRPLISGMKPPYIPLPEELEKRVAPEDLLSFMDRYGVDMACLIPESMMDTTGYATRWVTNGETAEQCEKHPDRFILTPNVGPIVRRGLNNAIWEMEYLVRNRGAKAIKFYPPEDTYINDQQLWPFYEKIVELGIPIFIHTGWSWVPPGLSKYCVPVLLDEVATAFPEMKIVAYHAGWPYPHDLNLVAATHPNVYVGVNLLVPWALAAPRRFAHLIGEAIRFAGPDKVVWGTDFAGFGAQIHAAVEGLRDFQIPEDMQAGYGYTPLTEDDKRKIFGENLARLLKVEIRRRVAV
jgi:hypothetical protein